MKDVCTDYGLLLDRFLTGAMSVEEFQFIYLEQFKNERRQLDGELYELLEGVFGDLDSFTTDPQLLAENPGFYLDEARLREKVRHASNRLLELGR